MRKISLPNEVIELQLNQDIFTKSHIRVFLLYEPPRFFIHGGEMFWRERCFDFFHLFPLLFFLCTSLFFLLVFLLLNHWGLRWHRERSWHCPLLESLINKV